MHGTDLNGKAARRMIAVSYVALTLFLLSLIGYSFLNVSFGVEGTETVTGQDQRYTYLSADVCCCSFSFHSKAHSILFFCVKKYYCS